MIYLTKVFLVKFLDKFMSTTRNILLIKNKIILSALSDSLGFVMAILVVKAMNKANTIEEFLVMAVSVFVADMTSHKLLSLFDKDKEWLHIIQISDRDIAKDRFNEIRDNRLDIITSNSYNDDLELTLVAYIKTKNKNQARLLSSILNNVEYKEITLTNL